MMEFLHALMSVFAAFRLVDLFMSDRITQRIRQQWPLYIWACPRCLSVWCGILAVIVFMAVPIVNWPLAISWVYMSLQDQITTAKSRKIIITLPSIGHNMTIHAGKDIHPRELQIALTEAVVTASRHIAGAQ